MGTAEFKTVLKKLRVERGWTQKDLGIRLGASKTAVASWEQGARIPKLDKLEEIARLFNVDVNYLIGENQEKDYSRFLWTSSVPVSVLRPSGRMRPCSLGRTYRHCRMTA